MDNARLSQPRFTLPFGKLLAAGAFALATAFSQAAHAGDEGIPVPAEYLESAAAATGWTSQEVRALLNQAVFQPRILELMTKPAEKAMPWHVYHSKIVTPERIAAGREFLLTYADALARAEATYGVPKEIIAGIIGIETRFGTIKGNYRVLDALTTLSFNYPRRASFFQKELTAFLKLAKAGHVDPLAIKGSYAGAIGWPQFMPSNISKLATDFDDDGVIDLYNNPVDAIGSVGKYFKESGWRTGGPVIAQVVSEEGSNVKLDGAEGPLYFKAEHNFEVIKRYNRSNLYASAVYAISQQLRAGAQQ